MVSIRRFFYRFREMARKTAKTISPNGARRTWLELTYKTMAYLLLLGLPYQGVSAQGLSFESADKLLRLPKYHSLRQILNKPELYHKPQKSFDGRVLLVLPFKTRCAEASLSWLEQALAHRFAEGLRGFPVARPELITGKRLLGNNRPYVDLEQLTETLKDPSQKGFWQKKDTPLPPKGLRTVVWRDWQSYLPSPFQGRECTKKPPREGDADLHWDKDQWHKNFATLMEVLYKGLRQAESKEKVQFLLLGGEYHLAKQEPVWGQNRDDGHLSVFLYDGSNDRVLWQGRQDLSLKAHESAVDAILFSMKKALRGGTSVIRVPSLSVPYRVYVNERYIGRAPCSVSHLKEGSYKVSLRYQFRSPREIQVNLGSDEERVITPPRPEQQQAPSGALDVRATPMAHVYVNGKYVGQTPLNQKIASGHHRLRLEREGYQTREQGLFLARGERAKISWQLKKQEGDDGRDRSYQVYEPYQGWNFFRNGSTYELAGKYALAFSVLSFTAAIVADGLGKRKVDSREDTTKVNENPYQVYTSVFLTSGLSSLLASGVFLYISLSLDDGGFADYSQPGFSRAKAYGGEPKIPWIREKGRSSVRAHLSLTRRF